MHQGFSLSLVSVSLILLLWMGVVLTPPCRSGFPQLPITNNPDNFGFQNAYPILTIKQNGNRFFEYEFVCGTGLSPFKASIEKPDHLLVRADARLSFGAVRRTLQELSRYRTQGIVLMTEENVVEPEQISPFEEYLLKCSRYCSW